MFHQQNRSGSRTKQNISDANWREEHFLYMPASVCDASRGVTVPGQETLSFQP